MKTILIIEDNTDVRENIAEILQLSGYHVVEAANGKIGVAAAQQDRPDLIICDVMMPELDGFGVLRILNRDPQLMHIPFMFLTAKAEKTDFRRGMGLGADDYITKPFDDVELLDAIEMRLKKSSLVHASPNTTEGIQQLYDAARGSKELLTLSEGREQRKYIAKDVVYQAGQYPRYVYYIVSGKIKCARESDTGKQLIQRVSGSGEWLGYMAALQHASYQDKAEVIEDAELLLVPVEDFMALIYNNKDVSARLIQMLAERAEDDEQKLVEIAYSSVRRKVARALLEVQEKSQGPITLMREDLASLAGTAKESTIRMISDFKSEGIVSTEGGVLTILDLEALRSMHQ